MQLAHYSLDSTTPWTHDALAVKEPIHKPTDAEPTDAQDTIHSLH